MEPQSFVQGATPVPEARARMLAAVAPLAVPAARQGSGVLSSMAASDALAHVPAGVTLAAGDPIDVFPFAELLG